MNESVVINDMRKSSVIVNDKIKPIIASFWPNWKLIPVEGENNEICKLLDMSCGVDYLLYSQDLSLVYGIASRVQYGVNYRTFTVRKERDGGAVTEYEKRISAIYSNAFYPKFTMQAYIIGDNVAGLAIVQTKALMKFITDGWAEVKHTNSDKIGQAEFYACKWDIMKKLRCPILEYKEGNNP